MLTVFSRNPNCLYIAQCFVFLVVLGLFFSCASPNFLTPANIGNILTTIAVVGLMAIGATFIIASGSIDLSSASIMALSGTVAACLISLGLNSPLAVVIIVPLTGALFGFLNGMLINVTRAPSFIVTLGMLSIARAIGFILAGGKALYGLPNNIWRWGKVQLRGCLSPSLCSCWEH